MKRILIVASLVSIGVLAATGIASANPPEGGPPGQGECDHGNSQQSCKPDPQPSHGQDCDEHGNHGGVNEDHCSPAPTVNPTPTPPVITPTPEVTSTPEVTPTPEVTSTPAITPTPDPTETPRPTPTIVPIPTETPSNPTSEPTLPATDTE